ncbi:MAG: M13 family metallopeptidase [Caulobacterales bacterium]
MKKFVLGATALAAVASLGLASLSQAADPTLATPPATEAAHAGPWGFDLAGRDPTVAPGRDFYEYANGDYLKSLQIPADRSSYGAFDVLQVLSQERVHGLLERAAADSTASGDEGKIGAFYRAFMDEGRVEALDAKPLAPELAMIRSADSREAIASLMGRGSKSYFSSFFGAYIASDAKDPDHYAVYLGQAGLGLPDRDYYLQDSFAPQKARYQAYVAQMLAAIDWPNADAEAKAIVDMETQIAQVQWSRAQGRDPVKSYNPMTPAELARTAPGFPWNAYLRAADLGRVNRVVVGESTAFPKIAEVFARTPIHTLRAWEAFNVTDSAAPYLSKRFVEAEFEFRNKALYGQREIRPRWKRAAAAVNNGMGEAVGRVYVAQYFPPESKAKALALVGDIRAAMGARIQRVSWMSDATKHRALEKLSKLSVKIGYPVKWRDYGPLAIGAGDLFGDVERAQAFEWAYRVGRLHKPVDREEWGLTPQTVNAYYSPTENEIVFPAAILQPPFFDPSADTAVNYGAIGAVIGHEMTHGFDDEGRQFDGTGKLTDWWAPEDAAKFAAQTTILGAQYSAFEPLPGAHVKGDQTMGENIADLGGVLLALDAYHMSLNGRPAPVLDGVTGDQRVFFGFAQVWRSAERDDALRSQLVSDVHAPAHQRVDGVVRNVDAWYAAFDIKPTDPMYVAPENRVRIW